MVDVRISEHAKDQLIRLKRVTGIKNWNTLCRWAFCLSLNEDAPLDGSVDELSSDSGIEMRWDVFGGEKANVYEALLAYECFKKYKTVDEKSLARLVRAHIHRGIDMLVNTYRIQSLEQLVLLGINFQH